MDEIDRRILAALVTDAGQSYAKLSEQVGLSPPAVHDRVKKLRASGAIKGVEARIDPAQVGKALLAFVHVDTIGWGKTPVMLALGDLPEVEEIHSVTGDTCMLLKVRVTDSPALEGLLARIYDIKGVQATRSYVALSTYLERPPQAGVTADLHVVQHPEELA
ncbi:Lrp/AsnC family transcriptional regulator [Pontivivens ytuae]|uniref:Lrp/AsnC family transcriptional regulator n=1 Tax=Pontivivens ytuae TaxID=2789856 RepID=A0A7S9LNT1_9RHOB|nr:Lrp/AsnC family transcriptional regulator [Pontivivens ytuae]QPH52316.1 Lrp/AsnC family transcriptional regulator [Pontivivens ytuae]